MSANRGSAWTAIALTVILLAVEAVVLAESWRGLAGFAHLIGITGPAAWGVPVTLDGVSLVAALVALRAELAGEASGLYRLTLFVFTAASAAANYWHGRASGGTAAAVYLGGMSIAVAVVFALALRQIRHEDRRRAGAVTSRLPKFSPAHWARYPALTWRAWSLAVRDGHTTARDALTAAAARTAAHPDATTTPPARPAAALPPSATAASTGPSHPDGPDVAADVAPSHPRVSQPGTMSHATVALSHDHQPDVAADVAPSHANIADLASVSQADAIRYAITEAGTRPARVVAWLAAHGRPGVAPQRVSDILRRDQRVARAERRLHAIGPGENAS
jgi:hypothetical protein